MPISVLMNLGFAGGGGVVTPPATTWGDLTFVFKRYVETLLAAHGGADDASTQVMVAQPGVRTATHSPDDLNTAYDEFLN